MLVNIYKNTKKKKKKQDLRNKNGRGWWRRFRNEEIHSLCRSPNIVRVIKSRRLIWEVHLARMEEARSALKILTGTFTGRRSLGRPRRRWEENIRKDLKEIGINARNWIDSVRTWIIGEPL